MIICEVTLVQLAGFTTNTCVGLTEETIPKGKWICKTCKDKTGMLVKNVFIFP